MLTNVVCLLLNLAKGKCVERGGPEHFPAAGLIRGHHL